MPSGNHQYPQAILKVLILASSSPLASCLILSRTAWFQGPAVQFWAHQDHHHLPVLHAAQQDQSEWVRWIVVHLAWWVVAVELRSLFPLSLLVSFRDSLYWSVPSKLPSPYKALTLHFWWSDGSYVYAVYVQMASSCKHPPPFFACEFQAPMSAYSGHYSTPRLPLSFSLLFCGLILWFSLSLPFFLPLVCPPSLHPVYLHLSLMCLPWRSALRPRLWPWGQLSWLQTASPWSTRCTMSS